MDEMRRTSREEIYDEFAILASPMEAYSKMLNILADLVIRVTMIEDKLRTIGIDKLVRREAYVEHTKKHGAP